MTTRETSLHDPSSVKPPQSATLWWEETVSRQAGGVEIRPCTGVVAEWGRGGVLEGVRVSEVRRVAFDEAAVG